VSDAPQKVSQFDAVLSTFLVVAAMERFASRDIGFGWKIAVLTGAGISCVTITYKALGKRTSVNLDTAASTNYVVSSLCLFVSFFLHAR
jgi:hypothetical protein